MFGICDNKIVAIKGICITIVSIVSSLAIFSSPTLVSDSIRALVPIPNYLAIFTLLVSYLIDYKTIDIYRPLLFSCLFLASLECFYLYEGSEYDIHPLSYLYWLLFGIAGSKVWVCSFKLFRKYLVVSSIIGIIAYVSFVFSLGLPYQIQDYYDHEGWYYVNFIFAYLSIDNEALRLCGLFNEPGLLGTMLGMCLVADGLDLKKKENIILFIAGCFSLSLAFFMLLICYLFMRLLKNPKMLRTFIIGLIVILLLLPLLYKIEMVAIFLDRFTFVDGKWVGYGRTPDAIDRYWSALIRNGDYAFGYGSGYLSYIGYGYISYKSLIFEYGILGTLILWGSLMSAALWRCGNKYKFCIPFIVCYFINIVHRPTLFDPCFLLILFGGIEYMKQKFVTPNTIHAN